MWESMSQRSCVHPTTTPEEATLFAFISTSQSVCPALCYLCCRSLGFCSVLPQQMQIFFHKALVIIRHEICVPSSSNKCGMVNWIKVGQPTKGDYFLQPSQLCDWAGGQCLWLLTVSFHHLFHSLWANICWVKWHVFFPTATVFALQSTAR